MSGDECNALHYMRSRLVSLRFEFVLDRALSRTRANGRAFFFPNPEQRALKAREAKPVVFIVSMKIN